MVTQRESPAGNSSISGVSTGATCGNAMPPMVPPVVADP
jgi:hypothetical protein